MLPDAAAELRAVCAAEKIRVVVTQNAKLFGRLRTDDLVIVPAKLFRLSAHHFIAVSHFVRTQKRDSMVGTRITRQKTRFI